MRAFWPDCCSLLAKRTGHLFSFHPETPSCHSESFGKLRINSAKDLEILRRFAPQNDNRETSFRMDTYYPTS